ncbi:hypothetical protein LTR36_005030 [Oleoguttula mirabilis]|uniref:Cas1p 10 TM acyl transferase domain-containing protein n=1 Tax=Oleoguttula mirabilis TaxID=1507867 RepID=A0AAV9JVH0_9PEZI|nr:hypothetical protein LTR36_005030 [Oleoguttula mirabilis]
MARTLDGNLNPNLAEIDLHYSNDEATLEYLWDPFLNGTGLHKNLAAYRDGKKDAPMLIVIGGGQWHVENHAIEHFASALDGIVSTAQIAGRQPDVGFRGLTKSDGPGDLVLFAPVQEPYSADPDAATELAGYYELNAHLNKLADEKSINVLWSFGHMTAARQDQYVDNTINVQGEVLRQRSDVLLNLRCNAKSAATRRFPNVQSCCGTWAGPNWIQTGFLTLGLAVLPAVILLDYLRPLLRPEDRIITQAFCAFTSTVSLMYITDRTHIFEQVQRLPLISTNLRNMIIIVFLIGALTLQRSKPPASLRPGQKQPDQPYLPRDQTEEWKGWMQALIVIYHYNMAWSADWYWEIIRLTVASYLFLTGFGHTVYFLQKKDYSFKRVAAVMIRTNLLPCTLAFVMRTRWLLYYYMPLSTFWFLIVYATLAVGRRHNAHTLFVIGKILASAALVRAFLNTRDLPETVVRLFALTCNISFDAGAFFHLRVAGDSYIVYIGMLAAMFYIWSKNVLLGSDLYQDTISRRFRQAFPLLKHVIIAISLVGLFCFWYWVYYHIDSQADFVSWQPYITFVPILAFTVLRNAHPYLRNVHSVAFAWLGRYSGEMYVMQDHLWLAGDQEAVLRTGLFYGNESVSQDRWRDLLLITPLYLIACSLIGNATVTIMTWFVQEPVPAIERDIPSNGRALDDVEMSLLSGDGADDIGQALNEKSVPRASHWERLRSAIWPNQVRNRAIVVLAVMWLLNMTYT